MKTKYCYSCGQTLPVDAFYSNKNKGDGLSSNCKECQKAWRKGHYQRYKKQTDETIQRWRDRNPVKYRAIARDQGRKNAPKQRALMAAWMAANGFNPYTLVNAAVKGGTLTPQPCRICGSLEVEAHHNDYHKPLEVVWYCRKHHRRLHFILQAWNSKYPLNRIFCKEPLLTPTKTMAGPISAGPSS